MLSSTSRASALLTLLLASPPVLAQSRTLNLHATHSKILTLNHEARGLGLTYDSQFRPWLDLSLEAQYTSTSETSPYALVGPGYYHDRTHAVTAASTVLYPVRFSLGGTEHRLGGLFGIAGRYRNDVLSLGGYGSVLAGPEEDPIAWENFVMSRARNWESGFPNNDVLIVQVCGYDCDAAEIRRLYPLDSEEQLRTAFHSGYVVGHITRHEGLDYGPQLGLAYEVEFDRAVVGARVTHRRFRNATGRISGGSHLSDFSLRLGYRF